MRNEFLSARYDIYTQIAVAVGVALQLLLTVRYFASIAGSCNMRLD